MSGKKRARRINVEGENLKEPSSSEKKRLSVFERLGPGAPRKFEGSEKEAPPGVCHKYFKIGFCDYGKTCKYTHIRPKELAEYRPRHDEEEAMDTLETESKHSRDRDSKKDKIKSTVVMNKQSAQDDSDSDPAPDCSDEDLQRRLSQLKQELNRLDQEEKDRERREKSGVSQVSSAESEDAPPMIVPANKMKKDKLTGEKKKKEKKKKKKKLKELDKTDKHPIAEKDAVKAPMKSPEKQKSPEKMKPKLLEKKKSGPMIPRAVQQKVVKPRHESPSPERSRTTSPPSGKKKKVPTATLR